MQQFRREVVQNARCRRSSFLVGGAFCRQDLGRDEAGRQQSGANRRRANAQERVHVANVSDRTEAIKFRDPLRRLTGRLDNTKRRAFGGESGRLVTALPRLGYIRSMNTDEAMILRVSDGREVKLGTQAEFAKAAREITDYTDGSSWGGALSLLWGFLDGNTTSVSAERALRIAEEATNFQTACGAHLTKRANRLLHRLASLTAK